MEISGVPQWMSNLAIVAVAISVVVMAVYTFFNKKKKDDVDAEDRLIDILKKTVDELSTKVDGQGKEIVELREAITDLESENEKLVEILQGRDEKTQEFYRQAFEAFKVMQDTQATVKALSQSFVDTNKNIESLVTLMSKHVDVIDHSISAK